MRTLDRIRNDAEAYLSDERYKHTVRVESQAVDLGLAMGLDESELEKVRLSSLLHDFGKAKNLEGLLADKYNSCSDLLEKLSQNNPIYHAHMGVEIARLRYGIDDIDILDAIRYHTTGRANMKTIEKIVYLADYIEPGRNFEGLEEVRKMSYQDLDMAILMALDGTIVHIINRGLILYEDTVKARNSLIKRTKIRGERI